jgi:FkbM family methyltransferase
MPVKFLIFRILVLLWNNLPGPLRRVLTKAGFDRRLDSVAILYGDLPTPPTERPVKRLIERLVQPGWVCADVGANYGMMTEVMASKTGLAGHVIAFEAHPFNAGILRRRMSHNGIKNVTVENQAVADGADKSFWLFAGRRKSPNEWNIVGHDISGKPTRAEIEIPAVALDDYFGNRPLHLVKIDVEGAEPKVLAGMQQVLRHQKPPIVVEFHSPAAWESRHHLLAAGYRIFTLDGRAIGPESALEYHVCALPPGFPEIALLGNSTRRNP